MLCVKDRCVNVVCDNLVCERVVCGKDLCVTVLYVKEWCVTTEKQEPHTYGCFAKGTPRIALGFLGKK